MRLFGLIGYPLGHSFSRKYFYNKFEEQNLTDCRFENFEMEDISTVNSIFDERKDLLGCSVTIPHKETIIPYLEWISPEAEEIGAVNCIKVRGGRAFGYNTDWVGFTNSIKPLLHSNHNKALILGTGGAAKAVAFAFKKLGMPFKCVSRKKQEGRLNYSEISEVLISEHAVVVNCTPLGMYPNVESIPELPYHAATANHLFFDLIYNPAKTVFLETAEFGGAVVKNGLEMLHLQAEAAWEIWNEG